MRHNRDIKRFGRPKGHLRALMANLTNDVIEHGKIKTTTAKAKEIRRYVDRMITLGKKGEVSNRRQAFAFLRSKKNVTKLFESIAPVFKDRNGGYTRIVKIGLRQGDGAPMSVIELVEQPEVVEAAK